MSLDKSDSESVSTFVDELTVALSEDMAEFRETEIPVTGEMVYARPCFQGMDDTQIGAFFDKKMGRLYVAPHQFWNETSYVTVAPFEAPLAEEAYRVVRREDRYKGDTVNQLVLYLARDEDADKDDS